jgi:hypothetical protein
LDPDFKNMEQPWHPIGAAVAGQVLEGLQETGGGGIGLSEGPQQDGSAAGEDGGPVDAGVRQHLKPPTDPVAPDVGTG